MENQSATSRDVFPHERALSPLAAMMRTPPGFGRETGWRHIEGPIYQGGSLTRRETRTFSHLSMIVDDVHCEDGIDIDFYPDCLSMSVTLEEVGGKLRVVDNHQVPPAGQSQTGFINILPAGCRFKANAVPMKFLRQAFIQIDERHMASVREDYLAVAYPPRVMIADPRLSKLCQLLSDECLSPSPGGMLYADSLTVALMVGLAKLTDTHLEKAPKAGLAPWQLRKTQNYILDHVALPISLDALAALIDFSPAHFCRAFKVTTGKNPHQWLTDVRMDLAKAHLLDRSMCIADIALTLGFCDQSHFTRTFGRHEGTSPLAWQRSRLA